MAAEPRTKPTNVSAADFIAAVPDARRRADAEVVLAMLTEASGEQPVMWGPSIVGFGSYRGQTGDWPIAGFSPRKANLVVYLTPEYETRADLLARLGKHKTGKSCLYLNRLSDVDLGVLRQLVDDSIAETRAKHPKC